MELAKKPYEWMVKFTPQKEWIERRGILLWLAFFFGGAGSGVYLWSLYSDSLPGMLVGWLIVAFGKGITHLLFLGKPLRFWRGVVRPQSSWLARGFWFMVLFLIFGAIQMALTYSSPGSGAEAGFKILAGIFAFMNGIYEGFVMGSLSAIPFWNSALLPVLFMVELVLGGTGLSLLIGIIAPAAGMNINALEWGSRVLLPFMAIILALYFIGAAYGSAGAKASVRSLIKGPLGFSLPFWILAIIGIVVPLILVAYSLTLTEVSSLLLLIAITCELVLSLSLRYAILKAGIYNPLLPTS